VWTGARSRWTGSPAEDPVAARRQVGRAVDGRHLGARRRDELAAVVSASQQPVAAGAFLIASDAGRRTRVWDAWSALRVTSLPRVTRVVRARTQRALRPPVTPSPTPCHAH